MIGYIYCFRNIKNNKVYIGQTVDIVNRIASHKYKAETVKTKFYNAVRKYGWNNFEFSIIAKFESSKDTVNEKLNQMEIYYVNLFDSYNNGYNSTLGGKAQRGYTFSEEFKEKCRNRVYSEETKAKMSKAASNRKISEETRAKHRENALKRDFAKYRELTTEKRVAALRKAKNKKVLQLDLDYNIVQEFDSVKEAVNYIQSYIAPNLSKRGIENGIIRHCKGKINKECYYGFIWKYKTDV